MTEMTFGERLRYYRNLRGISANKLSKILQCEMHTVYVWEWNDRLPSGYYIVKICKALNITPNQLLGWEK